jgi:hypothetical protein
VPAELAAQLSARGMKPGAGGLPPPLSARAGQLSARGSGPTHLKKLGSPNKGRVTSPLVPKQAWGADSAAAPAADSKDGEAPPVPGLKISDPLSHLSSLDLAFPSSRTERTRRGDLTDRGRAAVEDGSTAPRAAEGTGEGGVLGGGEGSHGRFDFTYDGGFGEFGQLSSQTMEPHNLSFLDLAVPYEYDGAQGYDGGQCYTGDAEWADYQQGQVKSRSRAT